MKNSKKLIHSFVRMFVSFFVRQYFALLNTIQYEIIFLFKLLRVCFKKVKAFQVFRETIEIGGMGVLYYNMGLSTHFILHKIVYYPSILFSTHLFL